MRLSAVRTSADAVDALGVFDQIVADSVRRGSEFSDGVRLGLAALEVADVESRILGVGVTAQRLLGDVERRLVADVDVPVSPHPRLVPVVDGFMYAIICHHLPLHDRVYSFSATLTGRRWRNVAGGHGSDRLRIPC
ncbi:hypothetical protein [Natrinema marinum]|uniref:hypothetical protein n=1 Tax=Natrinema marinum TaxID=2961598 RepID=UPI0020C89E04|nr:hypothetical protein [Natrinema marinum]